MNKVSILLVDNTDANTARVDAALDEAGINYMLYFTGNGQNGLDILMGDPYHELIAPDAIKIKPALVIISKELEDISAREFLSIVGRYYSLRDTKFLLLSDSLTDAERLAYDKLGVSAYLQRPLDKEQVLTHIKPLLNGNHTHIAFIPLALKTKAKLVTFVKGKIIGMGLGTKLAAGFASVLMVGTVTVYTANNWVHKDLATGATKMPERVIEQTITAEPAPEAELTIPQKKILKKVAAAPENKETVEALKDDNIVPVTRPNDLRIVAIEEADSTADK